MKTFKVGDKVFYLRFKSKQIFKGWITEFKQFCSNEYKLDTGETPEISTYVTIYHGIGGRDDVPLADTFVLDDKQDFKESLWFMTKDIKKLKKCVDAFYEKEVIRLKEHLDTDYLETIERENAKQKEIR